MSKQLLRCGTAIGALMCEAKFAQSRADFVSKTSIALKEANETLYWLNLLHDSGYIDDDAHCSIHKEADELTSILVSIVKRTKENTLKYASEKSSPKKEEAFVSEEYLEYGTSGNGNFLNS